MNDDVNEDWIRTLSWDLGVTTLAGLFDYLGGEDRQALMTFMKLPAWQVAPNQLKAEADQWLSR